MDLEKPFLAVFFILLLFLGVSNLWDHKLQHDFPYSYMASDTFQQQTRAEGIKDAGNYRYEPFYIVNGWKDVIGYYPPLLHHAGVLLSFSSGIPAYDTVYFMVFFNAILAALVVYIIIRKYNRHIALLSLPLTILIFSSKSYVGFLWGHWASITGQLFLIASFWALSRLDIKSSEVLLGLFLAALALSHTSELIYAAGFIAIYSIIALISGKFDGAFLKKMIIAAAISLVLSAYSLYLFNYSFKIINPYQFEVSTDWGGTPIFYLSDFGLLLVFMAIGLVAAFPFFKKMGIAALAGGFMLLTGYTNYIGFGIRAFQPRLLWPVYLSVFFGLGLYMLVGFIPSKFKGVSAISISAIFVLVLSGIVAVPNVPAYQKVSGPGLMDGQHWESFRWISENTPDDSKIYFFYGDTYGQDAILRNSKRLHVQVIPEDFIDSLQNRSVKRVYQTEAPADHGAGMPYFRSFLKIGLHSRDNEDYWLLKPQQDICLFSYHVFDKVSRQPALAQYNLIIANQMLSKNASIVFENDMVAILKNNNVGGDCIEEADF